MLTQRNNLLRAVLETAVQTVVLIELFWFLLFRIVSILYDVVDSLKRTGWKNALKKKIGGYSRLAT